MSMNIVLFRPSRDTPIANLKPGFSRIRVSVTDLNSLQSAMRTAIFHVEK